MISLDLSTSVKFSIIWITLECYYVVNLILDSISIILVFYRKLLFFTLLIFRTFYQRMNKPNIHNDIGSISSFQNELNDLFSSTGFYLKSKVIEGRHKGENNMLFNYWALYFKMYILRSWNFFSPSGYPINSIFQRQYVFIRIMFLMNYFSS